MKITNHLSVKNLRNKPASASAQGTEDATKWNETLAPAAFALMHKYLFDGDVQTRLMLPQTNQWGELFKKIAITENMIMSIKQIQIGHGLQVISEKFYSRLKWVDEQEGMMSAHTLKWYTSIKERIDPDREFLNASPGMLMGMLNAGSTTLGLLPQNHRMRAENMRVMTLRSSDDSMTTYLADSPNNLAVCMARNIENLSLIGINMSPDKSFFFREGYGEYTSWYMEDKFVAQYGVETAAIRPQGKNPNDDFYSIAKGTSTALQTMTINPIGASARLRLGIDGVRRIWRIHREPEKRHNVKDTCLHIADGGKSLWTPMNCHIDDIALRELNVTTEEEEDHLYKIRHPDNPFTERDEEDMTFSKEHGMLVLDKVENPRNIFCYVKRSNRTLKASVKKEQELEEKACGEVIKIIHEVDPSTQIDYPCSSTNISDNLESILRVRRSKFELTEAEQEKFNRAVARLRYGVKNYAKYHRMTTS